MSNDGSAAEQLAATYLQQKGLKLLESNYRCRFGEIDLRKLRLARRSRMLGLSLPETRELVGQAFTNGCREYAAAVVATAQRRMIEVDSAIVELAALRNELTQLLGKAGQAETSAPSI